MKTEKQAITVYLRIYLILMALLVVTVASAFVDFGVDIANTTINLLIAAIKGILVLLFFMHVKYDTPLIRFFVLASFFWLSVLFVLTFSDYATRGLLEIPGAWPKSTWKMDR